MWKKDFLLHGTYLCKTLQILNYPFNWLYYTQCITFFFFHLSPLSLCTVFDSISSNIDEVLSINPSANVFVFGDFNVQNKDWLIYSGRIDSLVNFVLVFLSQMTLLRWLTFLLRSLTLTLTVLLFWTCFNLLMLVFILQRISLHWEIWSCCCLSFHWLSVIFKTGSPFHCIAYDYSQVDWDGLHYHLRDGKISLKVVSATFLLVCFKV